VLVVVCAIGGVIWYKSLGPKAEVDVVTVTAPPTESLSQIGMNGQMTMVDMYGNVSSGYANNHMYTPMVYHNIR